MDIKIHTHQLEMSDSLRTYAERHIAEAVETIYDKPGSRLDIEFGEAGREKLCRVTVSVPRARALVASAQDANLYAAVDLVADKIAKELRRLKEKRLASVRQGARPLPVEDKVDGEVREEDEYDFVEDEPVPPDPGPVQLDAPVIPPPAEMPKE